jgi:hypothetical protein
MGVGDFAVGEVGVGQVAGCALSVSHYNPQPLQMVFERLRESLVNGLNYLMR